jgi:hypothetical protein
MPLILLLMSAEIDEELEFNSPNARDESSNEPRSGAHDEKEV